MSNSNCIPANPDISGIGVRVAVYAQNLLSFVPAFLALADRGEKIVDIRELKLLKKQSTIVLITAFSILLSATIQARTGGVTVVHGIVILNLSWMNNTNAFIYVILLIHHKAHYRTAERDEEGILDNVPNLGWIVRIVNKRSSSAAPADIPPPGSRMRAFVDSSVGRCTMHIVRFFGQRKGAFKDEVIILGSLHLTIMAVVGIWLWVHPRAFGNFLSCELDANLVILGATPSIGSKTLRQVSFIIYCLVLIPYVNMSIPLLFLLGPYILINRKRFGGANAKPLIQPLVGGLVILLLVDLVFIFDTEWAIRLNKGMTQPGDSAWSFGQTLALVLLLVPLWDLIEVLRENQKDEEGHIRRLRDRLDILREKQGILQSRKLNAERLQLVHSEHGNQFKSSPKEGETMDDAAEIRQEGRQQTNDIAPYLLNIIMEKMELEYYTEWLSCVGELQKIDQAAANDERNKSSATGIGDLLARQKKIEEEEFGILSSL